MRFRLEQRFPGPLAQVEAALVDPIYLERLAELPGLGCPEVVHRVDAGPLLHLWVRYSFTGEVSPAVRKVVDPKRLSWVEESTLDRRTHRTTWRVVPDHYAALMRCAGTNQLVVDGAHTVRVMEGDIRVSVPLLGGRVERAIVSGLEQHAEAEQAIMAAWLGAPERRDG